MTRMRRARSLARTLPALAVVALFLACGSCRGKAAAVGPGEMFRLAPGASAPVRDEKIEVGFERVVADSRCPEGARCIHAGSATLRLWARTGDQLARQSFEAKVGASRGIDSTTAQAEVGDYRIQLLELDPYPRTGAPVGRAAYRALLRVTRR